MPANVAKAAALVEIAVIAVSDRVEEEADEADHAMVVEEASAVEAVEEVREKDVRMTRVLMLTAGGEKERAAQRTLKIFDC